VSTPIPLVRLAAIDLDGTLLRPDGTVSERTRETLRRVRDSGVVLVIVSARPPASVRLFARAAGISGLAICANGALVYDLDAEEVRHHTSLDARTAAAIVAALRQMVPGVCFGFVRGVQFSCEPAYLASARLVDHGEALLRSAHIADALEVCAAIDGTRDGISKLIVRHADHGPDVLLDVVRSLRLPEEHRFEATHSGAPFLEVAARGVTKARALQALCEELGIGAQEVVAFGDALNDLPMLTWAGRGFAMANAHPAVLAAADEVAPPNTEDGVAAMLERLLQVAVSHP
jgi:Cof subfamily protein (haloacid dehalogenase superfamily)